MNKPLLILLLSATGIACVVPLRNKASHLYEWLRVNKTVAQAETSRLAEMQSEATVLRAKTGALKRDLGRFTPAIDPTVLEALQAVGGTNCSPEILDRILAEFGRAGNSTKDYVLVSKAVLANAKLKPLKTLPEGEKLTDTVRRILALTPDEQRAVELAFAVALDTVTTWAKANLQREGPSEDRLVRYTIPADPQFEQNLTNRLFSEINTAIGDERRKLLQSFFSYNRIQEDGAIGEYTNIFSLHRVSQPPGLAYRAGWKWQNHEAINTFPEPIKTNRFPYAFFFVFPGGWKEVAQREGLELPEEFLR
jgi:hypothetical protein